VSVLVSTVPVRVLLYTDSIGGEQVLRDDMWAVTTADLNESHEATAALRAELAAEREKVARLERTVEMLREAGLRLIGAVEACAVSESGGPPVNWAAVFASQDAMRDALSASSLGGER